jgi:hypothetical protein
MIGMGIPKTLILGLAIGGVAFACGMFTGGKFADSKWQRIRLQDAAQTAEVITIKEVETKQCQAEVGKVNEATTRAADRTVQLIVADQIKRDTAAQKAAIRQKQSDQRLEAAFTTLAEMRRLIDAGAFEGCANERVGADIMGMLNGALAAGDSP